jgi:hypothetical protein
MPQEPPKDQRSKSQTEADEAKAVRESYETATKPVEQTRDEVVEPRSAMEVQGDLPGRDDNSRLDNPPGWDKARDIADEFPVGAGSGAERPARAAHERAAAFRDGMPVGPEESDVQVRPAGPNAARTKARDWDKVDEEVDESFPASDPPANY